MAVHILDSMQEPIRNGDSYLWIHDNGTIEKKFYDRIKQMDIFEKQGYHPSALRFPDRFQKKECICKIIELWRGEGLNWENGCPQHGWNPPLPETDTDKCPCRFKIHWKCECECHYPSLSTELENKIKNIVYHADKGLWLENRIRDLVRMAQTEVKNKS
jgi:hypothetical protein